MSNSKYSYVRCEENKSRLVISATLHYTYQMWRRILSIIFVKAMVNSIQHWLKPAKGRVAIFRRCGNVYKTLPLLYVSRKTWKINSLDWSIPPNHEVPNKLRLKCVHFFLWTTNIRIIFLLVLNDNCLHPLPSTIPHFVHFAPPSHPYCCHLLSSVNFGQDLGKFNNSWSFEE